MITVIATGFQLKSQASRLAGIPDMVRTPFEGGSIHAPTGVSPEASGRNPQKSRTGAVLPRLEEPAFGRKLDRSTPEPEESGIAKTARGLLDLPDFLKK